MAFHPEQALSLTQLQTPASQAARDAARSGAFPGPMLPSQQFTIQGGLQQLNSEETEMLQSVVNRLRNRVRQNAGEALGDVGAGRSLGRVFRGF